MNENPVKIIRWSKAIIFESGTVTNMQTRCGPMKEIREYAERIAKENDAEVVAII